VDDAFGDAFTVETRHLFKEKEVFENYGAAGACGERVLVIANRTSGVRCHRLAYFVSHAILQDVRSKRGSAGWKPNPLSQGESDRETVANKVMGHQQALTDCPYERKHASSSSLFRIAAALAAHAASDFKYGNTCPREQQISKRPSAVVVEEHLQLY
jgi:hypothetical protein